MRSQTQAMKATLGIHRTEGSTVNKPDWAKARVDAAAAWCNKYGEAWASGNGDVPSGDLYFGTAAGPQVCSSRGAWCIMIVMICVATSKNWLVRATTSSACVHLH